MNDEDARRKMKSDLEEVKQKLSSERDPMEVAAEYVDHVLVENGSRRLELRNEIS